LQKNVLGFSFFAVVMFIGVLSERTQIYKSLVAIRAELSIVACILSVGHIVVFGNIYLVQAGLLSGALSLQYVMATVAALLAVILMIPLLITSFKWIRAKMSVTTWKRLQKTSYLFYALVFAHLLLFIGPSSLAGASGAVVTFIVYTALFVTYIVLRIAKELRELNAKRGLHGQKAGI
jgi:DMSO/TMAO reductase YedYZ heme-binding membrane subunit